MSKEAELDRIHNLLADYLAAATAPDVVGPPSAPAGSVDFFASGNAARIYTRPAVGVTDASGWIGQNLTRMRVFNIKNFGAVGDNATDNSAAINAAITAAVAAGGGTIYIPPGQYAILKPVPLANFELAGADHSNLIFLGDGHASQLRMKGSAGFGTWYLFRIRNFAQHIGFYDLYFDASQTTNPDASEQQHFIINTGLASDPAGSGAYDVDVVGCFFGDQVGDGVRQIAESGRETSAVRVLCNDMTMTDHGVGGARACYSIQRFTGKSQLHFNYLEESTDSEIDFEPTATGSIGEFSIIGNIINHHQSNGTVAFSFAGSGTGSENFYSTVAYNVIPGGGGGCEIGSVIGASFVGNIFTKNSQASANTAFDGQQENTNLAIIANVFSHQTNAVSLPSMRLQTSGGNSPASCIIADNCLRSEFGSFAAFVSTGNWIQFGGNVASLLSDGSGNETILSIEGNLAKANSAHVGNIAVANSAKFAFKVGAANGIAVTNPVFAGNLGHTAAGVNGFIFDLGTYSTWQYCGENMMIGGTTTPTFALPPGNVGMSLAGFAGPGAQQVVSDVAAGPAGNVKAPVGSLCMDTVGGVGATLYYKETGAGISGGTAGWVADGPCEITFGVIDTTVATAARFMAPGSSDLAAASTVEIGFIMPVAKSVRNFRVKQVAGVGGGTITYTLRKNQANTGLTATINVTATTGGPAGTNAFAVGDLMSVQITKSIAPGTAPTNAVVTIELVG